MDFLFDDYGTEFKKKQPETNHFSKILAAFSYKPWMILKGGNPVDGELIFPTNAVSVSIYNTTGFHSLNYYLQLPPECIDGIDPKEFDLVSLWNPRGGENNDSLEVAVFQLKKERGSQILYPLFDSLVHELFICLSTDTIGGQTIYKCTIQSTHKDLLLYGKSLLIKYLSKDERSKIHISIVKSTPSGLTLDSYPLDAPEVNIELNYGKGFYEKDYKIIVDKLNTKSKGIFILSGLAGSGKSHFLQHLASIIDRRFIFMSTSLLENGVDSPALISLLARNPNSVLLIEDGEKYIVNRKDEPNSLVASLLNASDGILANILSCSIILTHNQADSTSIDPALLRRGRLQYSYVFNALSLEDTQKKIDSLGLNYKADKGLVLGEIYNLLDNNNIIHKEERKIGFGR